MPRLPPLFVPPVIGRSGDRQASLESKARAAIRCLGECVRDRAQDVAPRTRSEVLVGCEIQVDVAAELVDTTTQIDSNMTEGVPGGVEKHTIVATESIIIMNIAPRLGRIEKFRRGDRMLY